MLDLEDTRRRLEERLALLEKRTERIEADLSSLRPQDSEDRATTTQNDMVLEHLDSSEHSEIEQIHAAISRIDQGTYGDCVSCGEPIGEARLRVAAVAIRCIVCAERS